jgi:uncharacterized protein with FMN-binding domain
MDQQSTSKKREIIAALAVLIVIVAIVGYTVANNKDENTESAGTGTTTSNNDSSNSTAGDPDQSVSNDAASNANYKDGTYNATGAYTSPGGRESIDVTITLKDGVISDVSAEGNASDVEAEEYQGMFLAAYKEQVVGKNIDDVSLSRVSGSSLTSQGFNNALDDIKQEAETSA